MSSSLGKVFSASVLALILSVTAPTAATADETETTILAEINFARAHPQAYAQRLLLQPVSSWESVSYTRGQREDPGAFDEAVEFLMRQPPLPPLTADDNLAAAALEHVVTQGASGQIGHSGPTGERFDHRLTRHGVPAVMMAENITYGIPEADDVVRALIIDRGVPDRGHRRNIFHDAFNVAGVGCGAHRDHRTMCVIDFAGAQPEATGWILTRLAPEARPEGLLDRLLRRR